jgi:hypothetical protein
MPGQNAPSDNLIPIRERACEGQTGMPLQLESVIITDRFEIRS